MRIVHCFGLLITLSLLMFVAGCGLFQPDLSLEAAVAQMVPNDPPIAQHADRVIGDDEIVLAVELWIKGEVVPRSGGMRINDAVMKRLIVLWANSELITP